MKSKIIILIAALFVLSLTGCSSKDDEEGTIFGVWRAPAGTGQSEGFLYELAEDGTITSSYGGVLYIGGTYEVKGNKMTLKNFPEPRSTSSNGHEYIIVDYTGEQEVTFELAENELRLTGSSGLITWTKASSVIPTPTPTPTPPPTPVETPTPLPELESFEVLYGGSSLPFKDEFSLRVGEENKLDKFTIEFKPDNVEAEVTIVSEDEEIFIVELLGGLPNNAFSVTGISRGNALLTVTAGDLPPQRIIVRVTDPD